eukprot:Em0016g539a
MSRDPRGYLLRKRQEAALNAELAQQWAELENDFNKRLWHQLTEHTMRFVRHPSFQQGGLLEFYHEFLMDFEHKIKPLSLVEIILVIADEIAEANEKILFFEKTKEKVKNDLEAKVLCLTAIGLIKLQCSQLDEVKQIMEEVNGLLETVDGVTAVHARYYDLCSSFHKVKADHGAYYRDALRYLGCVDVNSMSDEQQVERALSLSLAALLGDDVYNFGELLAHPILASLQSTSYRWLINLLRAFNTGDLTAFNALAGEWELQTDLANNSDKLSKKIRLLALMELVFSRHSHNRTIPFKVIAETAQVPTTEVEHLIMKALSRGLVKGTIDEISKEVNMTWVQPRVLDLDQVKEMKSKMSSWSGQIQETVTLIKNEIPDIVAHTYI